MSYVYDLLPSCERASKDTQLQELNVLERMQQHAVKLWVKQAAKTVSAEFPLAAEAAQSVILL